MIKNIFIDNKGSALAMVIIIVTILSTLGLAIMSLGAVNFRMSVADQRTKLSFYMAESGLEQAYGIILNEVKEAVIAGNEAVKKGIDSFIESELENLAVNGYSDYITVNENGSYVISEEKIKEEIEQRGKLGDEDLVEDFQKAYKDHFKFSTPSLITNLENPDLYSDPQGGGANKPSVEVTKVSPSTFFSGSDETKLTLASTYGTTAVDGYAQQKVHMDFTIRVPEEIPDVYYVNVVKSNTKENPVWYRTMAAFGEIVINDTKNLPEEGNHLVVLGNIYAEDGVRLKSTSPNPNISNPVKITGNVATRANVEIDKDSQGCSLKIKGNIFAKNLLIGSDTDNSTITVDGNLYAMDDLELNGTRANVTINGNFYGFSDGSDPEVTGHDQSSGIVINALDINDENGSFLTITGLDGDAEDDDDEVFIAGVSYVDIVTKPYPTGESLSIKGNYRAYSYYLPDTSIYAYDYYAPLTLVDKRKVGGVWPKDPNMTPEDKAAYFKLITQDEYNPTWLNPGKNVSLPEKAKMYTLGAYFDQGNVIERGNERYTLDGAEVRAQALFNQYYDGLLNDPMNATAKGRFPHFIVINDEINNDKIRDSDSEFVFFSQNKSVYLIGTNGTPEISSATKEVKNVIYQPVHGIIVTEKDVYLRGKLNFTGLIIAGGNIYIEDSYPKSIKLDKDYISEVVGAMDSDDNPFLENEEYGYQTYEKKEVGTIESASVNLYKQYIAIDSWRIVTN